MNTQLFVDQIIFYKKQRGLIPVSIPILNKISLSLKKGEILGLIGENNSGKSLLAKIIASIEPYHKGKIYFDGNEITQNRDDKVLKKSIQLIFQNPEHILNPFMSGKNLIKEVAKSEELFLYYADKIKLNIKNLNSPIYKNNPTEKQKIVIVRTFSLLPSIIISDESTSLMDNFQQLEVIDFFKEENQKRQLSIIFLSHDIYLTSYISDNIAILYKGRVVEIIKSKNIFSDLKHPYSKLFIYGLKSDTLIVDKNTIGCQFYSKCPFKTEICSKKEPILKEIEKNHFIACHIVS